MAGGALTALNAAGADTVCVMRFMKMHGLGNDYVFLDAITDRALRDHPDLPGLARRMSDRRFGVGSDGLIMLCPPEGPAAPADESFRGFRMRIWNADGSEAEMCGNGLRCAVRYAAERGLVTFCGVETAVETGAGLIRVRVRWAPGMMEGSSVEVVTAALPGPRFDAASLPADESALPALPGAASGASAVFGRIVEREVCGRRVTLVSVGNPHVVAFLDEPVEAVDLARVGPEIERHPAFPRRVNVQIVNVIARDHARMRSWERGAGLTLACGTGACAVLAAGMATGRLGERASIDLPGGRLDVAYDAASGRILKTGPAAYVSEGEWLGDAVIIDPPFPVLRTERLTLRAQELSDAPAIRAMMDHPEVGPKLLTPPTPYPHGEAEKFIARTRRGLREGASIVWAIEPNVGPRFAGNIGLRIDKAHRQAELGYTMDPSVWGKGYATEAAKAVIDHGFREMSLERIFASHFPWNPASGRVMEKAGLLAEGLLRGHVCRRGVQEDVRWFGLCREDWERSRR